MARKPKAGGKALTKKPEETQAEQSERFIKAARELGVDGIGEEFELLFRAVTARKIKSQQTPD